MWTSQSSVPKLCSDDLSSISQIWDKAYLQAAAEIGAYCSSLMYSYSWKTIPVFSFLASICVFWGEKIVKESLEGLNLEGMKLFKYCFSGTSQGYKKVSSLYFANKFWIYLFFKCCSFMCILIQIVDKILPVLLVGSLWTYMQGSLLNAC